MANQERGEIEIQVNDKAYILRLDLNALCDVESVLSSDTRMVTWQQALAMVERRSLSAVRAVLWAALKDRQPGMTLSDVGALMLEMGSVADIEKKLQAAVQASMPTASDRGTTPNPPEARRAGRGARNSSGPDGSA